MPILVRIPEIVTKADRLSDYRRFTLRAGASIIGLVLIVGVFSYLPGTTNRLVWTLSETGPASKPVKDPNRSL